MSDEAMSPDRLEVIASRLREEFEGVLPRETIERSMAESVAATEDARIQNYRPIFVERIARDRLTELQRRTAKGRRGPEDGDRLGGDMDHDVARSTSAPRCPTCGFPIELYRLAAPEGCCPKCRAAWQQNLVRQLRDRAVDSTPGRSIDDLI